MEIFVTEDFKKDYSCLPEEIKKKAKKQENIFKDNPFYPSLRTEKLVPESRQAWSFRVDKKYRVVFKFLGESRVVFIAIGPHDWIYKIKF
ncbi:MAG: hypothetical protein A2312_01345 [Candidatus Staskawiczbacteria bacterium RIFOXYB2_FULL_32_9]|uniref:Toxin YoeB n=1 Tax=Candidatus Staskawiczbacteria bacterium RIFOXYD1_FULL_32_13 TaxID=1802234 RepID=A0A1G2JRL5_9BACT|nr:MAG: Plasmid stabilization system [Parcubacteria group bacterium GW2011_GWC2_32_10]OGZ78386.1 MAG: hypothetical protein A2360_03655 [Candidatus Staskawiczbacteria bacterium RIFOXYB1_FULL_32_11]OGZ81358.1 MAG: hypothetical protein A2312_01345 [Candidatus Staskawiczbacteria bacterium RIFOXYB2_FULL_32_9]OGZ86748.1 MAG: hypothetical protein A2463_03890 [Candidatus Staskawiczbacteria bacterium RIFOXYC2_FULL_32_10]OGZ89786.1 MAG: hypothetical protein A2561_00135 [Candidatus Staskawiczbacteria bact